MKDLDQEHDDLVNLINSKLKDLGDLKTIATKILAAVTDGSSKQDELSKRLASLQKNNVDDVLRAI